MRLPLKTVVLSPVENIDKELIDDKRAGACAEHARVQGVGSAAGIRSGQAIAVVAKVLGIPSASLGNWVRQSAKGELSGAGADDKAARVSPGKLKEFKRIAMRSDKTDTIFAAMIHLAVAVIKTSDDSQHTLEGHCSLTGICSR